MISSRIYWIAGANESALGLQSKYKAPGRNSIHYLSTGIVWEKPILHPEETTSHKRLRQGWNTLSPISDSPTLSGGRRKSGFPFHRHQGRGVIGK